MDFKLELVPVPVADIDRARAFYEDLLGFVVDVDIRPAPGARFVQLTPPGSACSIALVVGVPSMAAEPGGLHGVHLVVGDIDKARQELIARGVEVGEIDDVGGGVRFAQLRDPDGNSLLLQEMAWRTGDQL